MYSAGAQKAASTHLTFPEASPGVCRLCPISVSYWEQITNNYSLLFLFFLLFIWTVMTGALIQNVKKAALSCTLKSSIPIHFTVCSLAPHLQSAG